MHTFYSGAFLENKILFNDYMYYKKFCSRQDAVMYSIHNTIYILLSNMKTNMPYSVIIPIAQKLKFPKGNWSKNE